MHLSHLSLTHFRNYRKLELDFDRRLTLLQGLNAQGKTNLLEAIYFLATSKPVHAQMEREIVDWQAGDEPIPYCRVAGQVRSGALGAHDGSQDAAHAATHEARDRENGRENGRALELEIILTPRGDGVNYTKQVRVNGVGKRSMDLVGQLRAVLFLPEDVKLVDGSPGERRRYLDIALCQIDPNYCRALANYQKIVTQRNSLLKDLREREVSARDPSVEAQLGFWDEKLVQHGSRVTLHRHNLTAQLDRMARRRHAELSQGQEELAVAYIPSFNYTRLSQGEFELWKEGMGDADLAQVFQEELVDANVIRERFAARLQERRTRELAAGATLYGPHRDDLRFMANGRDLRAYGSRGQQRSAALSLKLAEVEAMTFATGDAPLLLLDDVMSELDARRRGTLLAALDGVDQAIITTTDWDDFAPEFRAAARRYHVHAGTVEAVGESETVNTS